MSGECRKIIQWEGKPGTPLNRATHKLLTTISNYNKQGENTRHGLKIQFNGRETLLGYSDQLTDLSGFSLLLVGFSLKRQQQNTQALSNTDWQVMLLCRTVDFLQSQPQHTFPLSSFDLDMRGKKENSIALV